MIPYNKDDTPQKKHHIKADVLSLLDVPYNNYIYFIKLDNMCDKQQEIKVIHA